MVEKGASEMKQQETPPDFPCIYNAFNRRYPQYSPNQILKAMDLLSIRRHIVIDEEEGRNTFVSFGYTASGLEAYQQGYYQAAILKKSATISTAIFITTFSLALGLLEWAAF